MEHQGTNRKKVLCPIERNGKTVWKLLGAAFVNKDCSINVYLDGLPHNGRLQLRDWDEPERRPWAQGQLGQGHSGPGDSEQGQPGHAQNQQGGYHLRSLPAAANAAAESMPEDEGLPF